MPITLDATPGSATANSYATVAWADAYLAAQLYSGDWTAATADEKAAALITMTRALDTLVWAGYRASTLQALSFPRYGLVDRDGRYTLSGVLLPADIQAACAEGARQLLEDGSLPSTMPGSAGIKRLKAGSVEVEFTDAGQPQGAWVPPQVMDMIYYLLAAGARRGALNVPLVRA